MNILSMENVTKGFNEKILFENVSLGINDNDRIGVVGINGTGKSTFLKLVSGSIEPDSGKIVRSSGLAVQSLSQTPEFDESSSVLEAILHGEHPLMKIISSYETAAHLFSENPGDENLQEKLTELTAKMDMSDAWIVESQAKSTLNKLGISDATAKIKNLSGGQKKRIALAEALIHPADLLIMDEPTNHIDLETIKWLEDYLSQLRGALMLVTHDRYFLNRVVNRIIEIDKGRLYCYDGNFEYFLEKKTLREEAQNQIDEKRRRLYINELAWIRRGAKARTTKQKARISRFEEIKAARKEIVKTVLEIPVAYRRLGKKVLEFDNVSKSFNGKNVIKNFSIIISPGDRIGIVGPNGSGKTVLLNLAAGLMPPVSGSISTGETVRIAYYRQNNEEMDNSARMIDFIKQTAEIVETGNGTTISAGQMLERLLFDSNQQYSLIKNLSGGERRRLMLAKILMEKPNVLLLDEPTNDLDIQTLEVLEEYLEYFRGVVIVASHDRYFLDKTTDKLLAIKTGGIIQPFNDVNSYLKSTAATREETEKPFAKTVKQPEADSKKLKFTFAESREFAVIDSDIGKLEAGIAEISVEMNKCWSDYVRMRELTAKQKALQVQLSEKMDRWVYLHEIAEQMRNK
jgi:ABC transport system ATP-binding/permease protein